ncbi:MAG: TniB family NTP-binding protein [Sulfurovaceae bacterium]|nr:TniB family NTP-binding protein [Sulfurovaceae bacterium]
MKIDLTKETISMLDKTLDEKIAYINQETWINYPLAQNTLNQFENILKHEQGKTRVTSVLLVGSPNNGKTSILQRFIDLHPSYDLFATNPEKLTKEFFEKYNATGIPLIYIVSPSEPSETRLYGEILKSINTPFKESESVSRKQYLVEYYLGILNVEMLIIDEIHNILSGSVARQKQMLNAIKNLSNNLKIPIILSGTKDALRAVSTDTQISSRFRPAYLTKWKMDKNYVNLLATILTTLPLSKESDILNPKTAQEILNISDGNIGDIIGLLKKATIYALKNNKEKITIDEIKNCGYSSTANTKQYEALLDI